MSTANPLKAKAGVCAVALVVAVILNFPPAPARGDVIVNLPATYDKVEQSKVPGATVMVGGLTFSNFADLTGDLKDMDVTVNPVNSATEPGLRFTFSLSATGNANVAEKKSITFGYEVTSSGFADAALMFAGTGDTAGGAIPSVSKTLSYGNVMPKLNVTLDSNDMPTSARMTIDGAPTSIFVTETVLVSTTTTGQSRTATVSSVTNVFSVPEPSPVVLSCAGLFLGLAASRLRGRAAGAEGRGGIRS